MVHKEKKQKNTKKGIKDIKDDETIYNAISFLLLHN